MNRRRFLRTVMAASLLPFLPTKLRPKEQWHHATSVWKNGTVQAYVNGEQVSQMAFWNTVLDANDMLALANGTLSTAIKPEKLVWYYPLITGTVAND